MCVCTCVCVFHTKQWQFIKSFLQQPAVVREQRRPGVLAFFSGAFRPEIINPISTEPLSAQWSVNSEPILYLSVCTGHGGPCGEAKALDLQLFECEVIETMPREGGGGVLGWWGEGKCSVAFQWHLLMWAAGQCAVQAGFGRCHQSALSSVLSWPFPSRPLPSPTPPTPSLIDRFPFFPKLYPMRYSYYGVNLSESIHAQLVNFWASLEEQRLQCWYIWSGL